MISAHTVELARIIWDFHQLRHTPVPADVIIALGSNDLRVAEHAADLYHRGFGSTLVCTGGVAHTDDLLSTGWTEPEAVRFAAVATERGVPPERMLLETNSRNTAENLRFTRALLDRHEIQPRNIVIAVKPFMQRRAWATLAVEWPEVPASLSSMVMTLEEFCTGPLRLEDTIHVMLGDLQRLIVYSQRGYSAPQRIPQAVQHAYDELVQLGFTKHLIR
jgi:uncharacterized SAM-binding protein YcdF (DUF218 family)